MSPLAEQTGASRRAQEVGSCSVTARVLVISLLLILALCVLGFFIDCRAWATNLSTLVPPVAPLAVLMLLTALNGLRRRRAGLSRRELLAIYALLTVSAPLVAHGGLMWFLSCSINQPYYAPTAPQWLANVAPSIPAWFYPDDPGAVTGFFEGRSAVPWSLWWRPLEAWGGFFIALFGANLFLMLLFRKQWVNHERLSFPIAQVPLELVRADERGRGRLPHQSIFWVGFGLSSFLWIQSRLPDYFPFLPSLPAVSTAWVELYRAPKVGPLAGIGSIYLILWPWTIALAYLIPNDLSFSVWFFYLVRVALCVIAIAAGATPQTALDWYTPTFPAPYHQGAGAVLALALLAVWTGRRHLANVFRQAVSWQGGHEPDEPLAYRWVVLGLLVSFGYLIGFCLAAGSRLPVALALIGVMMAYHFVWARLRAENGMSLIDFGLNADGLLLRPFGTALLRPAEIVTISAARWAFFPGWGESCEVITGGSLDGLKIADSARMHLRPLLVAMAGAFLLALAFGTFVVLTGIYHYGFTNLEYYLSWITGMTHNTAQVNANDIIDRTPIDPPTIAAVSGGMIATFVMAAMRVHFWWWPLNPAGYIAANCWGSQWWFMPFFIGWLLKTVAIRYGGLRLYQRTVPAAIGIIVADRVTDVAWSFLAWGTGVRH